MRKGFWHESHTGLFGVWSIVSRQFVFGIQEKSPRTAMRKLHEHIGKSAYKFRFEAKPIRERDAHMFKRGLKYFPENKKEDTTCTD